MRVYREGADLSCAAESDSEDEGGGGNDDDGGGGDGGAGDRGRDGGGGGASGDNEVGASEAADVLLCAEISVRADRYTRACDALFDRAFDGTAVYRLPGLPRRVELDRAGKGVCVGVILGSSGSAKSATAAARFGAPARVEWAATAPLAAHFPAVAVAQEVLAAVGLNASLLCRSWASLSSGEADLADLARVLVAAREHSAGCGAGTASGTTAGALAAAQPSGWYGEWLGDAPATTLVVDEFTSRLDRETAQCAAHGAGIFLRRESSAATHGGAHPAAAAVTVVFVACQSDVVAAGALEPDWLYDTDCATCRWFERSQAASRAEPVPKPDREGTARAPPRVAMAQEPGEKTSSPCAEARGLETQVLRMGASAGSADHWAAEARAAAGFATPAARVALLDWNHTVSRFKIETWRQRRDNVRVELRRPRFVFSHRYVGPRNEQDEAYLRSRVQPG
eukprot:g6331.t1